MRTTILYADRDAAGLGPGVALGGCRRDRPLLRSTGTRSGSGIAARIECTAPASAAIAVSRILSGARGRGAERGCSVHAAGNCEPHSECNVVEHRRCAHGGRGRRATRAGRSPTWTDIRWRGSEPATILGYELHHQRGLAWPAYGAGRYLRCEQRPGAAFGAGAVHGAAAEPAQSESEQLAGRIPVVHCGQPAADADRPEPISARRRAGSTSSGDLIQSLSTAVVVLDLQFRITFVNRSAESLLGASERQLLGQMVGKVFQPSEALVSVCERTLRSRLDFRLRDYECRAWQQPMILDCRVSATNDGRNVLLELHDTSVERRLRQEAELIAQHKVSRTIVRQLAHEVKNPLGGMRGAAQLLQRQLKDAPLTQYTRVIIDEVDRLAALVDSILKPGGSLELHECNPHEVTEHVASLIEAEKQPGVRIIRDYDPGLPPISIDRNQIIQALLNIVRNAMQAVDENGTITIRTRALHNVNLGQIWHKLVLSIEVEDDGPGIPEELLENVFYPLISGRAEGTGLGLAIAQELVANHKGLIEVDSEPGDTRFSLRLPFGLTTDARVAQQ